jgi:hypothetical protein
MGKLCTATAVRNAQCSQIPPPPDSAAEPPSLLAFVGEVRSFYEKLSRQQNFVGRLNPEEWTTLIVPSVVGKGLVINHHEKLVRQTRTRLPFIILINALCLHMMKDLTRNRGTFSLWSKVRYLSEAVRTEWRRGLSTLKRGLTVSNDTLD